MTKITYHPPLSTTAYTLQQLVTAGLLVLMLLAVIGLAVLAVMLSAPLMGLMALMVVLLMVPVAMLLSVSPPIRLDEDGLTLTPFWGAEQRVAWDDIAEIRVYPLLPQPDQEVEWRLLQGRKRYRSAEGYMLRIPRLPWRYRMTGFFVGWQGQPTVAFTNRSHADYDILLQRVRSHLNVTDSVETAPETTTLK